MGTDSLWSLRRTLEELQQLVVAWRPQVLLTCLRADCSSADGVTPCLSPSITSRTGRSVASGINGTPRHFRALTACSHAPLTTMSARAEGPSHQFVCAFQITIIKLLIMDSINFINVAALLSAEGQT